MNLSLSLHKPCLVPHAYNPSIWEVKARGPGGVQDHPSRYLPTLLSSKFKISPGHMRTLSQTNKVGELERTVILATDFPGSERDGNISKRKGEPQRWPWNIPGISASVPRNLREATQGFFSALSTHRAKVSRPQSYLMLVPISAHKPMVRPLTSALLYCVQGQGALSERLRSFSMQDLTTIRGDGVPAPSGPPPPGTGRSSGKHGQPKMSRSASESAGSSGRSVPSLSHSRASLSLRGAVLDHTQDILCPMDLSKQRYLLDYTRPDDEHSHSRSWPRDCAFGRRGYLHQRVISPSSLSVELECWVLVPMSSLEQEV